MTTYHWTAYSFDHYEFFVGNHPTAEARDAQLRTEIESEIERLGLEVPNPLPASTRELLDWYNEQDLDECWRFSSYDFHPYLRSSVSHGLVHSAHEG